MKARRKLTNDSSKMDSLTRLLVQGDQQQQQRQQQQQQHVAGETKNNNRIRTYSNEHYHHESVLSSSSSSPPSSSSPTSLIIEALRSTEQQEQQHQQQHNEVSPSSIGGRRRTLPPNTDGSPMSATVASTGGTDLECNSTSITTGTQQSSLRSRSVVAATSSSHHLRAYNNNISNSNNHHLSSSSHSPGDHSRRTRSCSIHVTSADNEQGQETQTQMQQLIKHQYRHQQGEDDYGGSSPYLLIQTSHVAPPCTDLTLFPEYGGSTKNAAVTTTSTTKIPSDDANTDLESGCNNTTSMTAFLSTQQEPQPQPPFSTSLKERLLTVDNKTTNNPTNSTTNVSTAIIGGTAANAATLGWLRIVAIVVSWFAMSVMAIVTTKLLLTEWWHVPPMILTCQQFFLSSSLLRIKLAFTGHLQPIDYPASFWRFWSGSGSSSNSAGKKGTYNETKKTSETAGLEFIIMAGLFGTLDFLASNSAFGLSAPSFVETVKASDPITTTVVALAFGVDRISNKMEMLSLSMLVIGLLLSTMGNASGGGTDSDTTGSSASAADSYSTENNGLVADDAGAGSVDESATAAADKWTESVHAAVLVVSANFCFAFRAMAQKLYRKRCAKLKAEADAKAAGAAIPTYSDQGTSTSDTRAVAPSHYAVVVQELDDENFVCRIQQVGWVALLAPALICYHDVLWDTIWDYQSPTSIIQDETLALYVQISLVNAVAFLIYNWASGYVLSNLTVLHHSTLNCLRRLFAILSTCFFFNVPLTAVGAVGVLTSFGGFCGFTYSRSLRHEKRRQA